MLMFGAALRLAYWLRFELKISLSPEVIPRHEFYEDISIVLMAGCILLFALVGLYYWHNLVGGTAEYSRVFNACTTIFLLVVLATFIFPLLSISRLWLIGSWFLSVVLVGCTRFAMRRAVYYLRSQGYFRVRSAIVGVNSESHALARELQQPRTGYEVVGLIGIEPGLPDTIDNASPPLLGSLADLEMVVRRHNIRELVVSASALHRDQLLSLYTMVHSIPDLELRLSTGLFELLTTGVQIRTAGFVPLIGLKKLRLEPTELFVKTIMEFVLALVGLIALSPLLGIIALAIKLDSPGPVVYRRRVLGVGGKEFDAFKFRTMRADSDRILQQMPELAEQLKAEEKLKSDPRTTRLGKWLRKYSVDEVLQLVNVLLGQMSIVGPRMISPPEAGKYGNHRFNLLSVRPGISGLWQVSGRSDVSYEERIRLDMYYIRNYSIWLDLHILYMTVGAVIKGRGAY